MFFTLRRVRKSTIYQMLDAVGFRALGPGDGDDAVLDAILELSTVAGGLSIGDRARVYAEAVDHLDSIDRRIPAVMEEVFFDRLTTEIATYGSFTKDEGSELREEDREMAAGGPGSGGLLAPDRRAPAGERGRRERPGITISLGDPGETPEEPEPMEGDAGSGGSGPGPQGDPGGDDPETWW